MKKNRKRCYPEEGIHGKFFEKNEVDFISLLGRYDAGIGYVLRTNRHGKYPGERDGFA